MRHMTVTAGEIAQLLSLKLEEYTIKPTRFKPNFGNLHCLFGRGDKQGQMKLTAELPGNFVIDMQINLSEFARDGEAAATAVIESVREAHMAAAMRRHDERNLVAGAMQKMGMVMDAKPAPNNGRIIL